MKLSELKKIIDERLEQGGDLEVVIPDNRPSVGPISTTKVFSAGSGFDWNSGYFIIYPEHKLTRKIEKSI